MGRPGGGTAAVPLSSAVLLSFRCSAVDLRGGAARRGAFPRPGAPRFAHGPHRLPSSSDAPPPWPPSDTLTRARAGRRAGPGRLQLLRVERTGHDHHCGQHGAGHRPHLDHRSRWGWAGRRHPSPPPTAHRPAPGARRPRSRSLRVHHRANFRARISSRARARRRHRGDSVTVQYVLATYSAGQVIQSSWTSQPFTFTLGEGQVIPGWDKGVVGMKVGAAARADHPARPRLRRHRTAGGPGHRRQRHAGVRDRPAQGELGAVRGSP